MSPRPIKTPRGPGWVEWPATPAAPLARGARRFIRIDGDLGIQAVTSVDMVKNDSGDEPGAHLEWHVSLTRLRRSPVGYVPEHATDADVENFWLAIDPSKRRDCECKTTELVIVEPDGFTYTRPIGAAGALAAGEHEDG